MSKKFHENVMNSVMNGKYLHIRPHGCPAAYPLLRVGFAEQYFYPHFCVTKNGPLREGDVTLTRGA
jgi:hypothetical protein